MEKKTLLLVDGHGLAYRGHYALPELTAPDGRPTSAIVGFFNMFFKIVEQRRPDDVVVIFDAPSPTFRHDAYEDYKGTRKPTPEALKVQIPLIRELLDLAGFCVHEEAGLEADDILAATAREAARSGMEVLVLTADKDLLQILAPSISIFRPHKGVSSFTLYDADLFRLEYGFEPPLMADYLALVGDSADNIPGVAGIGDKSARQLLTRYGGVEEILAHLDELPSGQAKKLREGSEAARASLALTRLRFEGALSPERLCRNRGDGAKLALRCGELGLQKLLDRFGLPPENPLPTPSSPQEGKRREVAEEELFGEASLILLRGKETLLLGDGRGRYCRFVRPSRALLDWLEGGEILTWDYKELCRLLPEELRPRKVWDLRIVDYLLHPDGGGRSLASVLGGEIDDEISLPSALRERREVLDPLLDGGLRTLMEGIDLPLSPVLARMEERGIGLDRSGLVELSRQLEERIALIEEEIAAKTGRKVNINSPKQVGELLFDVLGLPPLKKTKTGYSTDVSVLEELASLPDGRGEIPALIVEHREGAKMLSAFVTPLLSIGEGPRAVVHSTFEQTTTATGRLSSRDPNLQNLPVFGHWAAKLRRCLVPGEEGHLFVAADYSQIELRVLAHYCGDRRLREAFAEGRDIHGETARSLFSFSSSGEISAEDRRRAKVINFGLLYGMSAFGLGRRLAIGRAEAQEIVDRYFAAFPLVADYLRSSVEEARKRGYTETLFGRRRPLDEVSTVEGRGGGALQRVAVNTPIQGTAADIAKVAMIRFSEAVAEKGREWPLVLQVHDSLVCQCPRSEADEAERTLVQVMERAFPLSVPLVATPKRGCSLAEI
ncbi:DNA polymerase I [Aminithiophilus ramosus]|uniref:DNA-directed DNA polymerase n=2 Tax=Synergistales TaxID=649776 RepID=A0A9Q7EXU3_9BACT|nr:DNA polymerase [Aminithiophilus ramosus]QTX31316.1 DNA polymerase I [Aminithiophilus ramosus]QVL35116.1 DNA polymerase I [Synergistota bacterium]